MQTKNTHLDYIYIYIKLAVTRILKFGGTSTTRMHHTCTIHAHKKAEWHERLKNHIECARTHLVSFFPGSQMWLRVPVVLKNCSRKLRHLNHEKKGAKEVGS